MAALFIERLKKRSPSQSNPQDLRSIWKLYRYCKKLPLREKAIEENPQIFLNCNYKNIFR